MKLNLKFEKRDFQNLREFEKAVQKQVGNQCYVGTNSICLYFDYPPELAAMLKPYPPKEQLEFELESSKPQ